MIYVLDIAVRKDKKVECDTVFTETKPSEEMCKDIAQKLDAEVIICAVGRFIPFNKEKQKELSFKALKEVINDE
jgi:hypothetical protein